MKTDDYLAALKAQGKELYDLYAPYRVDVPLGISGAWQVQTFETEFNMNYLRLARDGRAPGLGSFTRLTKDRRTIMSDTVPEVRDLLSHMKKLHGNVLISGLGLGMAIKMLCRFHADVQSITVLEVDQDVIDLTVAHYRSDPRVTIIHADAREWEPPRSQRWDCAWHDIWGDLKEDHLQDMQRLRAHYRGFVKAGRQFCWGEQLLKSDTQARWG